VSDEEKAEETPEQRRALVRKNTTEQWLEKQNGVEFGITGDGMKVMSLPPDLGKKTNALVPFAQVVQSRPDFEPVPAMVKLDVENHAYEVKGKRRNPRSGNDENHYALNRVGLMKLADVAGLKVGKTEWDYMQGTGVRADAIMFQRQADGTWRAVRGSRTERFGRLEKKLTRQAIKRMRSWRDSPEEDGPRWNEYIEESIDAEMDVIDAKTESKAQNRCLRALLGLNPTYFRDEFDKPFLVLRWSYKPDAATAAREGALSAEDLYGDSARATPSTPGEPDDPTGPAAAAAIQVEDLGEEPDEGEEETEEAGGEVVDGTAEEEELDEEAEAIAAAEAAAEADDAAGDDIPEWDDDEPEDEPAPPKPDHAFKPRGGPWKGKSVEEIVGHEEGRAWLAKAAQRRKDPGDVLEWLSWALGHVVTEEDLPEIAKPPMAE
jgi:hypothetical protein